MTTNTYEVRKHTETGWWQLVENGTVVGAWETKREAMTAYHSHLNA